MSQEKNASALQSGLEEAVVRHLREILSSPSAEAAPLPEELRSVPGMAELHDLAWGLRHLAYSLANGELDYATKEKGSVVGALKALQANLRHLTWQAQRIAGGEYYHRVNFLGDFSTAFNQMTEQLDRRINDLESLSEKYKELSYKDPLTGLYNRSAFLQFTRQLFARRQEDSPPSTLIIMDLDHFKRINDKYGHLCGDQVLCQTAGLLMSELRPGDICCRYGGEEFLLLLPEIPIESGKNIAERLRHSLEQMPIYYEGMQVPISASFGVGEIRPEEMEGDVRQYLDAKLREADAKLYMAKEQGRNRVVA